MQQSRTVLREAAGSEATLLAAAQAGDEAAFSQLIEPHRGVIHALCYRMLGSTHDADDAAQEVWVRAWRALAGFDGRSRLRTWLHRIATNVCLDALANRKRRMLPPEYGPAVTEGRERSDEPVRAGIWIEPYPDDRLCVTDEEAGPEARYAARESIELAFVAALQHLPPQQRCALILRDVLSFSAAEVAEMLSTSSASVNSAVQRARDTIARHLPDGTQQQKLRRIGDARIHEVVSGVIDAFERGDVEEILSTLAHDVTFSMPPFAEWYNGRDHLTKSWLIPAERPTGLRFVPVRANGQIALGVYKLDEVSDRLRPIAVEVLTLRGELISEITSFRDSAVVRRFGLPPELRPESRRQSTAG